MKQFKAIRIWEVLYPIGIYYAAQFIGVYILAILFPILNQQVLLQQLVATLCALPLLYWTFYKPDLLLKIKVQKRPTWKRNLFLLVMTLLCAVSFSIALNNFLGLLQISRYSASYGEVQEAFSSGSLPLQLVTLCLVVPITEEFLFREIIFGRCKRFLKRRNAILLSALLFGIIHVNIVQLVYATIFGILLAILYDLAGGFKAAALAHMAANLTSILRSETELFVFLKGGMFVQAIWAILFFMIFAVILYFIRKYGMQQEESI
ncbi:MAG: lysostaphin resistance A-like protein [Lachnospiraceae bacterium]